MSPQHPSTALLTSIRANVYCHIFAMRAGNCPCPNMPAGTSPRPCSQGRPPSSQAVGRWITLQGRAWQKAAGG